MLKIFLTPVGPYIAGFITLVIVGLGAGNYVQHLQLNASKADLAVAQQDLKNTVSDNSQDQATIATLQNDLARWRDSAENAAHAQAAVETELTTTQAKLASITDQVAQTETKDNALPSCARFLAMDVAATCPSHIAAQRLRASAGGLQGSSRN